MAKKIDLIGKIFTRLTVIKEITNKPSYIRGSYWECLCECGNTAQAGSSALKNGYNKSCGCLRKETTKETGKKSLARKVHPIIASGKTVFAWYKKDDPQCSITFSEFLGISQQNCFYCGIEPSNTHNTFLTAAISSDFSKENGSFIYNGMDRVDNTKAHIIDNVVPSCYICNRAKLNRTSQEFYEYISRLKYKADNIQFPISHLILPQGNALNVIKTAFANYQKRDPNITIQTFYNYSQLPCYYCSIEKLNCLSRKISKKSNEKVYFRYNGIDRFNSDFGYISGNIATCCRHCNITKREISLETFQNWIERVKNYQNSKKNQ